MANSADGLMEMARKCRACLGTFDGMRFISDRPQDKQLIDMFSAIVNVQWVNSDKIAPYLCRQCEFTLEMCYNFQRKCAESNNVIEHCLQKSDAEEEEEELLPSSKETEKYEDDDASEKDKNSMEMDKFPEEMVQGLISIRKEAKSSTHHCMLCNYFVQTSRALSAHMSSNHRDVSNSWCHSCNKLFEDVQEHQSTTGCLYEACPLCPRSIRKTCMLSHLRSHSETHIRKPKRCKGTKYDPNKYCIQCHSNVVDLKKHMKVHSEMNRLLKDKIFICNICDKRFKAKSKLLLHIRMHSGDSPYKCDKCDKIFPSPSDLKMHSVTHTGEKPWICSFCGKAYTQHGTLSIHLKEHTGLLEECKICNKTFRRKSDLRVHLRNHTGQKPYLCNVCGRSFLQNCHLRDHLQSHSDDRPYKCTKCDKAFKSKATLAAHSKIHEGDKQFKCNHCEYACFKPCRLREHMKQHVLDKDKDAEFRCQFCDENFSTGSVLKAHITLTHPEVV